MANDTKTCAICCEYLNKTVHKPIECNFCQHITCLTCYKTYIMGSSHRIHCINCRKVWTREMISKQFPDNFIFGEYKKRREELLYEEQRSFFPTTQLLVPDERTKKNIMLMIAQNRNEIYDTDKYFRNGQITREDAREKIDELNYVSELLEKKLYRINIKQHKKQDDERKKFTMKCPELNCQGSLSSRYNCSLCNNHFCKSCHIKKNEEDEHTCDPNIVKSIEEIKRTARHCPNCNEAIIKDSGCDQMWCTICHTAFNWVTGKIEKGIVHNPHFHAYMQQQGLNIRNPHEQICGGIPDLYQLLRMFYNQTDRADLSSLHRKTTHYRQVILNRLPTLADNVNFQPLRLKFLMNEVSEKEFKSQLQRKEKEREKNLEHRQALETYITVMEELFRQVVARTITPLQLKLQEKQLVDMVNTQIATICDIYKVKINFIEDM